jgi:cell division protein FtsB
VSDLDGDHQTRYEGIWPSLNKFLVVLILFTVTIPIAYSFMPEVKKRTEAAARIEELNAQIEDARMKLARLQREEFLLRNDREYVSMIARDRLDLMKDGETIYRIESPKPGASKPLGHR